MGEFQFIAFAELVFILEILLSDVEFTGLYCMYSHVGKKETKKKNNHHRGCCFFPFHVFILSYKWNVMEKT